MRSARHGPGLGFAAVCFLLSAAATAGAAAGPRAAAPSVVTVASGGETIPTLRTARGVTTMVSLPEEAQEAVCGDLYDAQSGNGGYVIQRSGRDLFLKPLRTAGGSNLFVKTARATFAFELVVVPPARAMRIVRVVASPSVRSVLGDGQAALAAERAALESERSSFECERSEAMLELDRRREELERTAAARGEALGRAWLLEAVRSGAAHRRVSRRTARAGDVELTLDEVALSAGGATYLAGTLRNRSKSPLVVAGYDVDAVVHTSPLVVSPGDNARVVVDLPAAPAASLRLRFVDPSGSTLVVIQPYR